MATIAKLDSNGIMVIPEPQPPPQTPSSQAGDSPQVDSSTGDSRQLNTTVHRALTVDQTTFYILLIILY